jgi:hypothetical protein
VHPDSSFETEMAADDLIRLLARDWSRRSVFNANLKVDAHIPFSLANCMQENSTLRSIGQYLTVTVLVWGGLSLAWSLLN